MTATGKSLDETARMAAQGDRQAQAELLRALQDQLFRFSVTRLGCPELAGDATQEAAVRILRGLHTYRGDSRVQTWAIGITLNVCREIRRRKKSSTMVDEPVAMVAGPDVDLFQREQQGLLLQAMKELTERQREAVVLRYFEGLSVESTAEAMGVAKGTVKATVAQAIDKLRGCLDGQI